MKIDPPLRILIVAGLCVFALAGLVVREGAARASGAEVLLRMDTVDPRALLSGHYVTIALQEPLGANVACPPGFDDLGFIQANAPELWVALAPNGDHHRAAGLAPTREEAAAIAPLVTRGDGTCRPPIPASGQSPAFPGAVMLDLGFDRFYVDQRQAERIEDVVRAARGDEAGRVSAIVSLGRDGRARLKGLVVDGERLELAIY